MTAVALAVAGLVSRPQAEAAASVLVEAEGFAAPGGWQVDAMSVEQMGSPYLIAHGLGAPVSNAATAVSFPETGDYAVWVRTRNWVPAFSNGAAPGRFRVAVNGVELAPVFGTTNAAWHWQAGGTATVAGASATVELRDLTGFDGRCDAIAFVKDGAPPPDDGAALAAWRQAVLQEPAAPPSTQTFDCVIVGGGQAGCCAALAAARSGVRVALVQDRPYLGGNASQEIRVATRGDVRNSIVAEIDTTSLGNGAEAIATADTQRLAKIQAETNITLYMLWRAYGAGTNGARRITHVDIRHTRTGARLRLQGSMFVDGTGDGWIGYWAGADYRMGREASSEFGESLAPAVADAKTMGNSLMWTSRTNAGPAAFPAVPWAMDVAGTTAATSGDWSWEYGLSLNTIADAEDIRDHLLRAIYGTFYNAKQIPANSNRALAWVPYVTGKRESRRLLGDHILTQDDMVNGVYFEDAIATTDWGIDLHYETAVSYRTGYAKTTVADPCYFPFRTLYSRNVPNLMMAGRCFSCTHVGIGSPRVMNTCGQMGVAVGYAAAMCREYGIGPRDIYRSPDRTVELQARITGEWPVRPPPATGAVYVVDNAQGAPAVAIEGTWTSGAGAPGYYGTNYLLDGNAGQGTKRVVFTPALTNPGPYTISLRWTEYANRASNAPVWVCGGPQVSGHAATDDLYIRVTQPDTTCTTGEMLVGRVAASDYTRGLLRFLLPPLPTGAVMVAAEMRLEIGSRDAESVGGFVGAEGLKAYRVTVPFTPDETTWNRRAAGTNWAAAGGDFNTNALTAIATPTDPNLVAAGQVFAFPRTAALTAAVQDAMRQGTPLGLILRTPTLESTYAARKLYRFGAATLRVEYYQPQMPPTYTVDQRTNGGQWVELGRHDRTATGLAVIVGNDGASGYVVADAVQFAGANATTNDHDGDGLLDAWERYYFLSETGASASADPDGDGRSNGTEFMTGTDPLDPYSRFDMRTAFSAGPGQLMLNWSSAAGRTYAIEVSEDLESFAPVIQGLAATPPQNVRAVPSPEGKRFYRVILEPPPP